MISSRWYLDFNIELNDLLQQYSFIPVCDKIQLENNIPFGSHTITFQHFFSIHINAYGSQSLQPSVRSSKAIYAKLSELSKKAIDLAIRTDTEHELLNVFKAFIYDIQSRLDPKNLTDINNSVVTKHKGRPPKRLIANVEKDRKKRVLVDSSNVNVVEGQSDLHNVENSKNIAKGRRCGKCNQYGHYTKTCQNFV